MSATLTPDVMAQEVDEGYRELEAEIAAAFGSEAFPVFETDVDADALWLAVHVRVNGSAVYTLDRWE